jgi:hypothetical protein
MAQKTINVGTVANDGTGDTIRGAFTNVNANFVEVYANISSLTAVMNGIDLDQNTTIQASFNVANAAFAFSNTVNTLAYNIGTSANLFSVSVGSAGNAYAVVVGTSSNSFAQSVGTSGNNYASILVANNAVGANGWANTVAVTTYTWANSRFTTLSNSAIIHNTSNAAFDKANTAFQNTSGTLSGNVVITGTLSTLGGYFDAIGSVREKFFAYVNSNVSILASQSVVFANNSNNITIRIPDDNTFLAPANIGTTIEVYQYGSGATQIIANDAAVTVNSSNNWTNISGQYLTATAVKVLANTWILTGDLRA